jgi:transposase
MVDLARLRADTREKYNEMKNATADGWERFKDSVDEGANKLDNAWDRFKADMKS